MKMLVGYMRSREKPGHMAKLLAIMCQYEGIDLVYFRPEDISMITEKVHGKMLINKKWTKIEVVLPKFIDINPNYFNKSSLKELIDFLNEHSTLSSNKRMPLPKDQLHSI